MKRLLSFVTFVSATAVLSSTARAQTKIMTPTPAVELGARLGYALPFGSSSDGVSLSDGVSGQVPIWLDAGLRLSKEIYVGLYGQYGFAMINNSSCPTATTCSSTGNDVRFGADLQYRVEVDGPFETWVGYGFGYEIFTTNETLTAQNGAVTKGTSKLTGFELANLQVGGDYKVTPTFGIGPFVSLSVGQYSNFSTSTTSPTVNNTTSGSVPLKALHEWFFFGLRGVYDAAL